MIYPTYLDDKILSKKEKKETKDYRNMRGEVLEFMTDAMAFQDEKFHHNIYPMFKELWGEIDTDEIKKIICTTRVLNHYYYNNFDPPKKDYYFRINKQKNQHLIKIITNVLQYLEIENVFVSSNNWEEYQDFKFSFLL